MQNSRIVVLDCETSTIHNGREPTCRYYMHESLLYGDVNQQRSSIHEKLQQVFDKTIEDDFQSLYDSGKRENLQQKFNTLKESFNKQPFEPDAAFTQFWDNLKDLRVDRKTYADMYKEQFTKKALDSMRSFKFWRFIKRGDEQYFYYDNPENTGYPKTYAHSSGTTIERFDIENKFHRDEVMRVCFGVHILSTCVLQFKIQGSELNIMEEPFYELFRQTPRYVHSTYVQQIHHLTEDQLKQSRHDITSLHKKLKSILDTGEQLTFVAHNAQQDRKWILQSISDQVEYHKYLSCKTGTDQDEEIQTLRHLHSQLASAKWFCTIYGTLRPDGKSAGQKDGSKDKIQQLGDSNTLSAVYEKIAKHPLTNHHNALTDTYACALIFCHLLKIPALQDSVGYKRILDMTSESEKPTQTAKRPKTLAEGERSYARVLPINRQYDIYMDNQKLPTNFVTDENTQVGKEIHLVFGDGVADRVSLMRDHETRERYYDFNGSCNFIN